MGKRGPQKTPTIKLDHRGSWRAKERKDEPQPNKSGLPPKPRHIQGDGAKFYKRVGAELTGMGVFTTADFDAFVIMCEEYQQYKEAEKLCKTLLIKTSNGNVIQNPAVGIRNKSREALKKSMSYFGMTPSSRAGLSIESKMSDNSGKKNYFKVG